jgi:integrase
MAYLTVKEVAAKIKQAVADIKAGKITQKSLGLNRGLVVNVRSSSVTYYARVKVNGSYKSYKIGDYEKIKLADAYSQVVLIADKAEDIEKEKTRLPLFSDYWKHYREITDKALNLSTARIRNKNAYYNTVLHVLADYRINEITPKLVSEKVSAVKTSQNNLNNSLSGLIACFTYAVNEGLLEYNPIQTITKLPQFKFNKADVKGFKWLDISELKEKLFTPLKDYPLNFKVYILLVALTASRGGEIRTLRWDNIDFTPTKDAPYGLITIANEDTKTKKDLTHDDHIIPLTRQLKSLLKKYNEYRESDYLFPSVKDANKPVSASSLLLPKSISCFMTGHGLRKTANTFLCANRLDNNFSVNDIDRILSHKVDSTIHRIYDKHDYVKELYRLLSFYNDYLEKNCLPEGFKCLLVD